MRRTLIALLLLPTLLVAGELDLDAPLPVDPNIAVMKKLENGLTYWIRPHKTPPGKVSMAMHVNSGSLNETDAQRGLAHFLEHMAFNGSKNFPPGTMVKFFESLGMQFGAHQNAFTSFDQTTYMMSLPNTEEDTIKKVLLYFGDVAHRLLLAESEIDKERGVILEEKRSRKGVQQRISDKLLPIALPGSRIADRVPIGLEEVITKAPRERFVEYYRAWYRPHYTTLIVCGDVDPARLEPWIQDAFADWKPTTEPVPPAASGVQHDTEGLRAAVITDPELTECRIGLGAMRPLRAMAKVGDFRSSLVDGLGTWMANRRLREMVQKGEAPFQSATLTAARFLNYARAVDMDATGEPKKWREMLRGVLVETKRAATHGFREGEFAQAKTAFLSSAERAARTEGTRDARAFIMAMNGAVAAGRKPMGAAQALDLTKQLLPSITIEEVTEAFRRSFRLDRGIVIATLPEKQQGLTLPTKEDLLKTVREAAAAKVQKTTETKRAETILEKDPAPVEVAARAEDEDLKILTVTLANGARVHFRTMAFKKDTLFVQVRFIGGVFDETMESRGITQAAALALQSGSAATKRLSSTDITNLVTGKKFGYGASPGDSTLVVSLTGSPSDIEDGFRLLHALLTEPRLEEAALERTRQQMLRMLPQIRKNVQFRANDAAVSILTGDDPRFGVPSTERIQAITLEEGQKWLDRVIRRPIEAAIVGDVDRQRMLELARKYLGSLPSRPVEREGLAALRKIKHNKGPHSKTVEVETVTPVAVVRFGWRGAGFGERTDARVLLFASQVLSPRLNKAIREDKGLTYSIQCAGQPSTVYDGLGELLVVFTTDPAKAEQAADLAKQTVLEMIGEKPPTDAEMDAVRKQIKNILDTQMKEPTFWAGSLSELLTRGRSLEALKTIEQGYMAITKEQIVATLKKYLGDERFYRVIAKPAAPK